MSGHCSTLGPDVDIKSSSHPIVTRRAVSIRRLVSVSSILLLSGSELVQGDVILHFKGYDISPTWCAYHW